MLLSGFNFRGGSPSDIDSIHNYYETLVLQELQRVLVGKDVDGEYIADVSCVALNNLPPRYIRHDVDMMFYLSSGERSEINHKVTKAVSDAIAYVNERTRQED
ncbi:late competence development ComFB family protein [Dasania sp. GY-MA-18]|uniref:Late competence development ComFB family protein n=1 Tax=Dasania phycosphaerae TaxID=2950436 RepID=A0A9J6RPC6_9GAMM|nr:MULTISPECIES: late competence development ComFB family protein [Dasania]MCR8923541.1 late competence development ComFB family protein [Dasania sp. GY-MA-18]MCZ0865975.1 late competence development ComFB family protein [Dasania phycosphaerae]MCZ0869699.1 late competence development ComFB family protein [Dasania phycosphaerae]